MSDAGIKCRGNDKTSNTQGNVLDAEDLAARLSILGIGQVSTDYLLCMKLQFSHFKNNRVSLGAYNQ